MISRQLCKTRPFTGADLKTNYPLPTETDPGL